MVKKDENKQSLRSVELKSKKSVEKTSKKVEEKVEEKELKGEAAKKELAVDTSEVVSDEVVVVETPIESENPSETETPEVSDNAEAVKVLDKFDFKSFNSGDTVRVHYKIIEGDKTRIQPFQGIVISKRGVGLSQTFMVRRVGADGIGVERIFPFHSPNITKMEIVRKGRTRRAKLYYLREKKGRAATKVKEAF